MNELNLSDVTKIGENNHGYEFMVGLLGGRWVGFAIGSENGVRIGLFFLPNIQEDFQLGVKDKTLAILLTGAIAQSAEYSYGGVARWFVGEDLRGDPEAFRCANCGSVGCDGKRCQDD